MEYKVGDRYEVMGIIGDYCGDGGKVKIGDIVTVDEKIISWWGKTSNYDAVDLIYYNLKKLEEKMFKVGDIITNGSSVKKVLAVSGELCAVSVSKEYNTLWSWWTEYELLAKGFRIKDAQVELSMDEIASKFGVGVKDLKIKKEK